MKAHCQKLIFIFVCFIFVLSCTQERNSPEQSGLSVSTTAITAIDANTAISGGNVTDDGGATITARGVCWSTATEPTTANSKTTESGTTGTFTSSITGLSANTLYHVRAYAVNSNGIAYGNELNFTAMNPLAPILTTKPISAIASTAATCGGNVTSDNGAAVSARGVCWSTTQNPVSTGNHTTDGSGTGSFISTITGLTASTLYYVRGYATNSNGTAYGNQVNFTTTALDAGNGYAICDGSQPTIIVDITSVTGKIWMDRNMGASQAATSLTDYKSYGCLYQWGRGNDGHASINRTSSATGTPVNGSTGLRSTTDTPGNALFITMAIAEYDWRNPSNIWLWQPLNNYPNNPCPTGYHVPNYAELNAEFTAYNFSGQTLDPLLKLTLAGMRSMDNAALLYQGARGYYWSSIYVSDQFAGRWSIISNGGSQYWSASHAEGMSVRCVKD